MKERYRIILSAETALARRPTLADMVTRPINPWLQLIPCMFILDFLKRTAEIRKYSNYYVFPRRMGLEISQRHGQDDEPEHISRAEQKISTWLVSQKLYSADIFQSLVSILYILSDHYKRLFQAEGGNYPSLIISAYETPENYDTYLNRLTAAEQSLLNSIKELPVTTITNRLLTRQPHLEAQRIKEKEDIFLAF